MFFFDLLCKYIGCKSYLVAIRVKDNIYNRIA